MGQTLSSECTEEAMVKDEESGKQLRHVYMCRGQGVAKPSGFFNA